jgi:hypothetical protein
MPPADSAGERTTLPPLRADFHVPSRRTDETAQRPACLRSWLPIFPKIAAQNGAARVEKPAIPRRAEGGRAGRLSEWSTTRSEDVKDGVRTMPRASPICEHVPPRPQPLFARVRTGETASPRNDIEPQFHLDVVSPRPGCEIVSFGRGTPDQTAPGHRRGGWLTPRSLAA